MRRTSLVLAIAACGSPKKPPALDAPAGCVDHGSSAGTGRFMPPAYVVTGDNPYAIAVADFDGDCSPDVAIAHFLASDGMSSTGVGITLNRGDGTFAPMVAYAVGPSIAIVAADLDGDGALDLVAAQQGALVVLRGHGDGTFTPGATITNAGGWLQIADLDEDGKPDLVTGVGPTGVPSVLRGNGDGTFVSPGTPIQTTGSFYPSLAADIDGDGHVDLAGTIETTTPSAALAVLRGHGDGTFEPATTYPCSTGASVRVARDLDGDGVLDLGMLGCNMIVDVWRGTGGGAFVDSGSYPGQTGDTVGLAAGDLDGDGLPDLAVADRINTQPLSPDNQLSWFRNLGGSFAPFTSITVGTQPSDIAIADVDGDGRLDLISPNAGGMVLAVVRGAP